MKYLIVLLIALVSLNLNVSAQSEKVDSASRFAKVILIRYTGFDGSLINMRLFMNDVDYCKIKNKTYTELYVPPGKNVFNVLLWHQTKTRPSLGLEVPMEAGKTYYLFMVLKKRYLEYHPHVEEITYRSAAPFLAELKKDNDCTR